MQERPMTPYQKTQAAAAIAAGCVVLAIAAFVWPRAAAPRTPVVAQAEKQTLRDAVSASAAPATPAMPAGFVHATSLTSLAALTPKQPAPKPEPVVLKAQDREHARALAATSGVAVEKVEAMRERGLGWDAIARKLGFRQRSAKLFAKRGIIIGQRVAGR